MIVGIGTDLVDIERVRVLVQDKGERVMQRLFTASERAYCEGKAEPARHLAARIAAKEAAFKALSGSEAARAIGWQEIEVWIDALGRPSLALHGRAAARAAELGVSRPWLSLTHGETAAVAMVVLDADG